MVEDLTSAFRGIAESGKTPWGCSDGPVSLAPSNPAVTHESVRD